MTRNALIHVTPHPHHKPMPHTHITNPCHTPHHVPHPHHKPMPHPTSCATPPSQTHASHPLHMPHPHHKPMPHPHITCHIPIASDTPTSHGTHPHYVISTAHPQLRTHPQHSAHDIIEFIFLTAVLGEQDA